MTKTGYIPSMTGHELKRIRQGLGLTLKEFGLALGYSGPNIYIQIWRFENDRREIPEWIARLAETLTKDSVQVYKARCKIPCQ